MRNLFISLLAFVAGFVSSGLCAQETMSYDFKGNQKINTVIVNSIGDVHLTCGDSLSLTCEDALLKDVKVSDSILVLSGFCDYDVTIPHLNYLVMSGGVSDIVSENTLKGDNLMICNYGTGDITLDVDYANVVIRQNGTGDVVVKGNCSTVLSEFYGTGDINTAKMRKQLALANAIGIGDIDCGISDQGCIYYKDEFSSVSCKGDKLSTLVLQEPLIIVCKDGVWQLQGCDSLRLDNNTKGLLDKSLPFFGASSTIDFDKFGIEMGNGGKDWGANGEILDKVLRHDDEEKMQIVNADWNWADFEFGLNIPLSSDYNNVFSGDEEFMNVRQLRSWCFKWNIADIGFVFSRSHGYGLFTGVGLEWNNYSFTDPSYLCKQDGHLTALPIENVSVKKSKLGIMYANFPLMFQIKHSPRSNWYVDLGVTGGIRLAAWNKIKLNSDQTSIVVGEGENAIELPMENSKYKAWGDYGVNLFKLDASVRLGFSEDIGFFADYAILPMFVEGKGPAVHPLCLGMSMNF